MSRHLYISSSPISWTRLNQCGLYKQTKKLIQTSSFFVWISTSRQQSAREETIENKTSLKIVMFDSQEYYQDRQQGLKKKKIINIQEFRPGRSAMQWHCGLRLFFNNIYLQYGTYATVHGVGCIKTSF